MSMKPLRFIPFRNIDILSMCLSHDGLQATKHQQFEQVYLLIQGILHFEFHARLNALKNSYAPFDPDADTRKIKNGSNSVDQLVTLLEDILNKANYEKIPQSELEQALNEESLFKIKLQVDFDDFSEVLLYCRGEKTKTEQLSSWFGLVKKTLFFTNYDRVVIFLKQKKSTSNFVSDNNKISETTFLKLFRNVPKADLEMLFPNTKIRMRTIDKIMIGVPAALSGGIVIATKLGATVILLGSLIGFWLGLSATEIEMDKTKLLILLAGVAALAGYLWKQLSNFKNKKLRFMKTLTDNLYFKNLDNNAGVFHRIIDDAEEEENKEIILAYYFLLISHDGLSKSALDMKIECWFKQEWQCEVNFEIDDALDKLQEYLLVKKHNDIFFAEPIEHALTILDKRWDNFFTPGKKTEEQFIARKNVHLAEI